MGKMTGGRSGCVLGGGLVSGAEEEQLGTVDWMHHQKWVAWKGCVSGVAYATFGVA